MTGREEVAHDRLARGWLADNVTKHARLTSCFFRPVVDLWRQYRSDHDATFGGSGTAIVNSTLFCMGLNAQL